MKKIKIFVKGRDIFGHSIELNINKSGDTVHNTFLGGIISFAIQICTFYYVYINVLKVITKSDDDIKSFESFIDLENIDKVYHDDLHLT